MTSGNLIFGLSKGSYAVASGAARCGIGLLVLLMLSACAGGEGDDGSSLADVAYWFRYEGAMFGHEALEERFREQGLSLASVLSEPGQLPRFLAASEYLVMCAASSAPAVVYFSALFDSLLVTRWSVGREIEFMSARVVAGTPEAEPPGRRDSWRSALGDSAVHVDAQSVLDRLAASRRQRAARLQLCTTDAAAASQPPPAMLITASESGSDTKRLVDSASYVGALQRSVLRYFGAGDPEPLRNLLGDGHELAAALEIPPATVQLAPVFAAYEDENAQTRSLILYADLIRPGRYVLIDAMTPRSYPAPEPHPPVEVGIELIRLGAD